MEFVILLHVSKINLHLFNFQEAKVGCDRPKNAFSVGSYNRKDDVFILLTLWVESDLEIGGKEERGFVIFMNWVSSCKKHIKV